MQLIGLRLKNFWAQPKRVGLSVASPRHALGRGCGLSTSIPCALTAAVVIYQKQYTSPNTLQLSATKQLSITLN